jgi:hypothetical protein
MKDMTVNESDVDWDVSIEDFTNQVHEEDVKFFTNGLAKNLKGCFKTIVESQRTCNMFLKGGEWSASTEFTLLPYLWHKPRQARSPPPHG